MEKQQPGFSLPRLDLNNFDSAAAEKSRYVLTSPRSLQSCARLGVKPVQLLIKSLSEMKAERRDGPVETMEVLHDTYEKERLKLLQMCREERERMIHEEGDWQRDGDGVPCVERLPEAQMKDCSEAHGQSEPVLYADLCVQGKSFSRASCCADRGHTDTNTVSSFSLGDLRHTQNSEIKLQRITKGIEREIGVTVSERDCKIAALMLVKHESQEARLKLQLKEEQRRLEERMQEEVQRAHAKIMDNKRIKQRMKRWNEQLEARRRLRARQDQERAGQLEQDILLQETRWRRLKEEVEAQRREKIEASHREADERKNYQEKLLREKEEVERRESAKESHAALEREERVRRRRLFQEKSRRKRLQEENQKEQLHHILLKHQLEQQLEEQQAHMRSSLERRLQLSWEKRSQAVEARLKELQEHAAREQQQIQKVQLRAKLQNIQELTRKHVLLQRSQRRIQRALLHTEEQQRSRAEQTRLCNKHRHLRHQRLREEAEKEEEAMNRLRESCIIKKEWKRERLHRQQQQILEEAQMLARASFHMRDRVKQQTHTRTFDQMVQEAQLSSSISRIKL